MYFQKNHAITGTRTKFLTKSQFYFRVCSMFIHVNGWWLDLCVARLLCETLSLKIVSNVEEIKLADKSHSNVWFLEQMTLPSLLCSWKFMKTLVWSVWTSDASKILPNRTELLDCNVSKIKCSRMTKWFPDEKVFKARRPPCVPAAVEKKQVVAERLLRTRGIGRSVMVLVGVHGSDLR